MTAIRLNRSGHVRAWRVLDNPLSKRDRDTLREWMKHPDASVIRCSDSWAQRWIDGDMVGKPFQTEPAKPVLDQGLLGI